MTISGGSGFRNIATSAFRFWRARTTRYAARPVPAPIRGQAAKDGPFLALLTNLPYSETRLHQPGPGRRIRADNGLDRRNRNSFTVMQRRVRGAMVHARRQYQLRLIAQVEAIE